MRIKKTMTILLLSATMMLPCYLAVASQSTNVGTAIKVSTNSVQNVKITATEVVQQESGLLLKGQVKRISNAKSRVKSHGHINVSVISPEGVVIYETETNYYPATIPRQGTKKSDFSLLMPVQVPEGSRVQLDFHRDGIS